ncbi:hypothetical protein JCM10212_005455 [Sporobolomyces blumeae]
MAPPSGPQQQRLRFSQTLKASSNSELTKRLRALHDELRDFDQDLVDTASLDKVASELIHPSLLLHKDKAIKAFVGCCLVDILRLYAPEAPYTQAELKDLFEFLVGQFKFVGNPDDPHQSEYFFIVDSLASVKSIVLICDLDSGSDQLVERVFKVSFDTISTKSPKNVEIALSDILLSLIEELASLPPAVTDILLSQFLPQAVKSRPAPFRLAVEVCKGSSDKLQRYVAQYFAEVIQESVAGGSKGHGSSDSEDDELDSDDEPMSRRRKNAKAKASAAAKGKGKGKASASNDGTDDLPANIRSAHDLIRSLNRHVPALLLNVIPLLATELTSTTSASYRHLATTCLGAMFAEKVGAGDLAQSFPAIWKEWGRRSGDVNWKVRVAVAGCLRNIWNEHAELAVDIEAILRRLLSDHDEKVRVAACQVFEDMDFETARHHVSKEMLEAVGERTTDRRDKVRQVAYRVLGRLFDLAFPEIESWDEATIDHFGWIPSKLADGLTYVDGPGSISTSSQLVLVDSAFADYILPLPKNESTLTEDIPSWVDRYLIVEHLLGDPPNKQRAALQNLTRLSEGRTGSVWEGFLQACEAYNSGIIDDKDKAAGIKEFLTKTIKAIAAKMADPAKAAEDLKTFAKHNEAQLYREFRVLLDPQTDLKTFLKNEKDAMKRLRKMGESVASTFSTFIRLSCYTFLNRSSIPHLLKRFLSTSSTAESKAYAASARRTLRFIAKTRPILFKSHVAELSKILSSPSDDGNDGDAAVELALHAIAKLKKADPSLVLDAKVAKRTLHFAREAKAAGIAKHAATIVALDSSRSGALDNLVEHLSDALPEDLPEDLVPHLAALARIARHGQDSFEQKSESITVQCLEILRRSSRAAETSEHEDATWIEDADLDPLTKARLLSLKVLTHRCIPFAHTDSASTVASPVFTLLWKMMEVGRFVSEDDGNGAGEEYAPLVASRIRLEASLCVLKLAATKDGAFTRVVLKNFGLLARTAQDTCFDVRDGYLRKVLQYLRANRVHPSILPLFNMSLFLIAHEPEQDLKAQIMHFVRSRSRRPDRQAMWEMPFVRLFSILARHPDFEGELGLDDYKLMAKYFELYLECIATNENVSLLYHLAQLIKGARDAVDASYDPVLYILSELAQHLIKTHAELHHWPLTTLPKSSLSIKLPGDAFRSLASPERAKEIAKTVYLPEDVVTALETKEKKIPVPRRRKAVAEKSDDKPNGTKKRGRPSKAAAGGAKGKAKAPKKRKSGLEWDSSEEDESDSESEEDDEALDDEGDEAEHNSEDGRDPKGKASAKRAASKGKETPSPAKKQKKAPAKTKEKKEKTRPAPSRRAPARGAHKKISVEEISDLEESGEEDEAMSE